MTIDVLACASRSTTRTFCRRPTDKPQANIIVPAVLPTPPRRLETAMNFVTRGLPRASDPIHGPLRDRGLLAPDIKLLRIMAKSRPSRREPALMQHDRQYRGSADGQLTGSQPRCSSS